jgi:hypothetical protein
MKINSEQTSAIQQQGQTHKHTKGASGSFGDVLAQEVDRDGAQADATGAAPSLSGMCPMAPLLQNLAMAQETQAAGPAQAVDTRTGQTLMDNVAGLLDDWEKYADQLKAPAASNLRGAYGQLEKISDSVQALKSSWPQAGNPDLKSVVDELEIMSVTEKIKFNRGDYL